MHHDSNRICLCPLEGIITTISKKWAILLITILGHHEKLRFNDLMNILDGISPKTLTDLLKELQRTGLVERESFPEIPPRVEYSLTDDGKELCEVIIPLVKWAEKRDNLHEKKCTLKCRSSCCPSRHSSGEGEKSGNE
ncbi:transcriptional regulator, HxlR family [Methanolacinia petrolearia DSM 11571]|uniref:Transcriptional regulator, HxlR family n=1 Tax=Methanolacinia petrolearia (strain DSM 11571 / OCM 486 / SEBR 4847) TaxID=679926 RepID=E1RGJ2_METP4|nr:helix-turn-helix domain-containing protein [Methanolacinia petrolearia]ADN35203.1 transcriptional regulator, HxlR family [Methanolacinia petrolearia DSM 11571]